MKLFTTKPIKYSSNFPKLPVASSSNYHSSPPPNRFFFPKINSLIHKLGHVLSNCNSKRTIKQTHTQIIINSLSPNVSLAIKMVKGYANSKLTGHARQVFDEMSDTNAVLCNTMIRGYCDNRMYNEAISLYLIIRRRGIVQEDNYTFPCVLKACSGLESLNLGLQLHCVIFKHGFCSDLFIGNALIAMYAKCSELNLALRVFDEMSYRRDVVTWNSMVAGYAQNDWSNEAVELCKEMEVHGIKPDAGTLASLLPALLNGKSDDVEFVRRMFDEMPQKDLVSWNAMIKMYVNSGKDIEAMELFTEMERCRVLPDAVTLMTVVSVCGDLSALEQGKRIHDYIVRNGLHGNLFLENALLDMYGKCGCLTIAREVFSSMVRRDVVSWTAMISAYGMHGKGKEALHLFEEMKQSGLRPDTIAFVSVLSACSHSGLSDEGRRHFDCMKNEYGILPLMEHYSCMVDLLGRAGKLEDAYNMIKEMHLEPNARIWGALLGACRIHANMSIGIIAADELFKLVPSQSGYYVLVSNMYASAGKWEGVSAVRNLMRSKNIRKLPGVSNAEVNNSVHSFYAGDTTHPQTKMIYAKLEELMGQIKEVGYIVEKEFVLHDIVEEEKEIHLAVHSEKLAIAFMLINTPPGVVIRITKNLRVCSDCHVATKLISKVTSREIIIRDRNRFHHFKDGECSCGDYW